MVQIMIDLTEAFEYVIHQVDVKSAFLYAPIPKDDEMWIKLPKVSGLEFIFGKGF